MKKTLLTSILGLAATVATVRADGFIYFENYMFTSDGIKYATVNVPSGTAGQYVDSGFTASLYWSVGTVSEPTANDPMAVPVALNLLGDQGGPGLTTYPTVFPDGYMGYFGILTPNVLVTLPGYVSGPVTFEVVVWANSGPFGGTNYASSGLRGHSQPFTISSVPTNSGSATPVYLSQGLMGANPPNGNFTVSLANVPPQIDQQPTNQIVSPGQSVTFSVSASGTQPFGYQWSFNGTNIANATNSTIMVNNVSSADAGNYSVVISNSSGSVTSSAAILTVLDPLIVNQPASQTVNVGQSVTFSVIASGSQPFAYQWSFNGANIADATNSTLTLSNVQLNESGNYMVQVSNTSGSTNSMPAFLNVFQLPLITSQPVSQTVNVGQSASFSVSATGNQPLRYQWSCNGVNILNATNALLTLTNVQSGNAGVYSALVSNAYGSTNSAATFLELYVPPTPLNPRPTNFSMNVPVLTSLSWSLNMNSIELIANGGFEAGTLTNWTVVSSGPGTFVIDNGTVDPPGPAGLLPPYAGNYSASGFLSGLSLFYMYQTITIPAGNAPVTLSWAHHLQNYSSWSASQQFQVRICDTSNNVLATAFTTNPGDPLLGNWVQSNYDLTAFAGQTVRVEFWVNAQSYYLDVDLDNVSVKAYLPPPGNITNDVYFGTKPTLGAGDYQGSTTNTMWTLPSLAQQTTYYWQIVARNGGTNGGPVWQFTTAGSTFIPVTNCVDMVQDSSRGLLYITAGNKVLRYNLYNGTFLTPFVFGTNLCGIDISPDNNTLAVADKSAYNSTNVWFYLVDLPSGTNHLATFPRSTMGGEGGTYSLAFGSDGAVLISSIYLGTTGWTPLRRYDPVSGNVTIVNSHASFPTMVSSSGDGSIMGITENGPIDRYDVSRQIITRTLMGDGLPNLEVAVNRNASQFAVARFYGTFIYDTNLNQIGLVGASEREGPVGLAYNPQADLVFFAWWPTSFLRVYETHTLAEVARYDCGYNFGFTGAAFQQGRVRSSRDGNNVFVIVGGGVYLISRPVLPPADLALKLSGSSGSVNAGSNLTYTITITNNGPNTVTDAKVFERMPAGVTFVSATSPQGVCTQSNDLVTCTLNALTNGANATISIVIIPTVGGVITNTAAVVSSAADSVLENNWATLQTTVNVIPPSIFAQPAGQTVYGGQNVSFNVGATGTGPLIFQWMFNSNSIAGATNATLVLTNIQLADAGNYSVVVTNAYGRVTSSMAALTVVFAPFIEIQPTSQVIVNGNNASLSVVAGGTDPLSYQWYYNGAPLSDGGGIVGASSNVLSLNAVTTNYAGNYTVLITNPYGSATSSVATVFVVFPPSVATPPADQFVVDGKSANLIVAANGTAPLSYQWYFDGTPLTDAGNVSGSASNMLSLTAVTTNNAGEYTVAINNPFGSVTSSVATVTIVFPPAIVTQPSDTLVLKGSNATFTVEASGTGPLSYQWYFNGNAIAGANNTTYQLTGVTTNYNGSYTVTITNLYGTVTSRQAVLTVCGVFAYTTTNSPALNSLTGLYEEKVAVTNIGGPISALQLLVGSLPSRVSLYNAVGTNSGRPYAQFAVYMSPGDTRTFLLQFLNPYRLKFTNSVEVVGIPALPAVLNNTPGIAISKVIMDTSVANSPRFTIAFSSTPGRSYQVLYSDDDMTTWNTVDTITAASNWTIWTELLPQGNARLFKVIALP
jgi:uncharacterized repeat protein (TIGR01451 family)